MQVKEFNKALEPEKGENAKHFPGWKNQRELRRE
jgi:hypothetical protein